MGLATKHDLKPVPGKLLLAWRLHHEKHVFFRSLMFTRITLLDTVKWSVVETLW